MDAYQHLGFAKPPFEPLPDVGLFFDTPTHAEALATLQYTVFAGKGCCVVVGESGYGKTLLAQMIATSVGTTTPILWVNGCGQPDNETRVRGFAAGRFGRDHDEPVVKETTFQAEADVAQFLPDPPLLIVDCADELPRQGWHDVIGWLANEIRFPRPVSVILLGLPSLLETLAAPKYVRLQRRVFRVCRLEPLSPQLTRDYICARIAAAGGGPNCPFTEESLAEIARLGQGNPALVNQLCDNALLEAYGDERRHVALADVGNALHAMFGGRLREHAALPAPLSTPFARPALPPVPGITPQCPVVEPLETRSVISTPVTEPTVFEVEDSIAMRLKSFEARMSRALRAVRQACESSADISNVTTLAANEPQATAGEGRFATPAVRVEAETC